MRKHDSLSPRRTGRAGFPHPALPETLAASVHRSNRRNRSQRDQARTGHLSVDRGAGGWSIGPLAAAP